MNTHNDKDKQTLNTILEQVKEQPILQKVSNEMITQKSNCSQEAKTLKHLSTLAEIVLLKADKSKTWVLLNKEAYINGCNTLLNDHQYYAKIEISNSPAVKNTCRKLLTQAKATNVLSNGKYKQLINSLKSTKDKKFYALPKTHKPREKWSSDGNLPPLRPIISGSGKYTTQICKYLNDFLTPIANQQKHVLRNTKHFMYCLSNTTVNKDTFFITCDVENLYSNIPQTAAILVIRNTLQNHNIPLEHINFITKLLEIMLYNNEFTFNKEMFKQIFGIAMGSSMCQSIANIYMSDWEQKLFTTYRKKLPKFYKRYIDDIFILFEGTLHELTEFINYANFLDEHIKLTHNISLTDINFLDLTVYKSCNNSNLVINTKTYIKPSNTISLIHRTSLHTSHTKINTIKGSILRYLWQTSKYDEFNKMFITLRNQLEKQGYSRSHLRTQKQKCLLTVKVDNNTIIKGFHPCLTCKYCNHLQPKHHYQNKQNENIIKYYSNCKTRNCIYILECSNCQIKYIGETERTLSERLCEHYSKYKHNNTHPLYEHFRQEGHHFKNIMFYIVQHNQEWQSKQRQTAETRWINKLKTLYPKGLNIKKNITRYAALPQLNNIHIASLINKYKPPNLTITKSYPRKAIQFFNNKI